MTLFTNAMIVSEDYPESIAARKTNHFPKKPAVGGIPARGAVAVVHVTVRCAPGS